MGNQQEQHSVIDTHVSNDLPIGELIKLLVERIVASEEKNGAVSRFVYQVLSPQECQRVANILAELCEIHFGKSWLDLIRDLEGLTLREQQREKQLLLLLPSWARVLGDLITLVIMILKPTEDSVHPSSLHRIGEAAYSSSELVEVIAGEFIGRRGTVTGTTNTLPPCFVVRTDSDEMVCIEPTGLVKLTSAEQGAEKLAPFSIPITKRKTRSAQSF